MSFASGYHDAGWFELIGVSDLPGPDTSEEVPLKSKLLICAAALLVVAGLVHRFEKPVLAQVRAALVENTDEAGRSPLELYVAGTTQGSWTVPAGVRWVVQSFTATCNVDNTLTMTNVFLFDQNGGQLFTLSAVPHFVDANGVDGGHTVNLWSGTGSGTLYADAGTTVSINAATANFTSGLEFCEFTVQGHVISNP